MGKVMLGTLLGFGLFVGAVAMALVSVQSMKDGGGNPLLLILSLPVAGAGLFVLYRAGRLDFRKPKFKEIEAEATGESRLLKNSKIVQEWNQQNDKREKLKMLEAAAAAAEQENNG